MGRWADEQALLGVSTDVNKCRIALPVGEAGGGRRLLQFPAYDHGCEIVTSEALLGLRGRYARWDMAHSGWIYFARPVDMLIACGDDARIWTQRGNIETWISYGRTIEWLRELAKNLTDRADLFEGNLGS